MVDEMKFKGIAWFNIVDSGHFEEMIGDESSEGERIRGAVAIRKTLQKA